MKKLMGILIFLAISGSGIAIAENFQQKSEKPLVNRHKNNIVTGAETRNFGRFLGESKNLKIDVNGLSRDFIEYSTPGNDGQKIYKDKDLMIIFHGGKGNAEKMKTQTIFADLAKSNNLVLVFPEGLNHVWNDGRKGYESTIDVEFVKELVKKYKAQGVNKIMATGFSNGGILSLRLACENVPGLNYVGAIAGSLPEGINCSGSAGKNIMMINGTDDHFILWEGGAIASNDKAAGGGRLMGIESAVKVFEKNNHCVTEKNQTIDFNFDDRSSVEKQSYLCKKGSLVFYKVEGGGHTMPGGKNRATLSNAIGHTNRDISTERELIDFLKNKN